MKRLLSALCAFALVLSFAPFHAFALTSPPDQGEVINIGVSTGSGITPGCEWERNGDTYTLNGPGPYTLIGGNPLCNIVVAYSGTVTLTFDNLYLEAPYSGGHAFDAQGANLDIWLVEDNHIAGAFMADGSHLSFGGGTNSSLIIANTSQSDGDLLCTNGSIVFEGGAVVISGSLRGTGTDIIVQGDADVTVQGDVTADFLTVEDGAFFDWLGYGNFDVGELIVGDDANITGLTRHVVSISGGTASHSEAYPNEIITITAHTYVRGQRFLEWKFVDSANNTIPVFVDDSTSPQTRFKMPGQDVTVVADFAYLSSHTLKVNGGAATVDGQALGVGGGGEAYEGETITITADAPDPGKVFDKWVVDSSNVTLADENEAITTFTMPGADVEVTATYKDDVVPVALAFTNDAALPGATLNQTYSAKIEATGGSTPYTFSLVDNSTEPPNGITLNSDGTLTGTPTETGTFPFEVMVTDGANADVRKTFTLVVSDGSGPVVNSVTVTGANGANTITTKGGTLQLSAAVLPAEAAQTVTWSIVGDAATLSDTALLTAVSNGTVTVRATSTENTAVYGELVVTISGQDSGNGNGPAVASVTVTGANGANTITTKGGTLQLSAAVLPAEAAQTVTWSIVGDAATLSDTALLTAVSNGTVTVRATSTENASVYGELVVTISGQDSGNGNGNGGGTTRPPSNSGGSAWTPSTVTFTGVPTGSIEVGKSFTVTPNYDDRTGSAGWEYDSSFFSATFNSPATFTALREGTSTITYTTLDGVKSSFTVTIGAAAAATDPTAPAPEGTGSTDDDEKSNPGTGVHPGRGAATSPIAKGGVRALKR